MSRHDIGVTLQQIREYAQMALALTRDRQLSDLEDDYALRLALERALEVVGEAASRLPEEFRTRHAAVEWRPMIRMRNVLAHGYDVVRDDILWDTVKQNIPALIVQIDQMLRDVEGGDSQ